jgi:hypothetical protein
VEDFLFVNPHQLGEKTGLSSDEVQTVLRFVEESLGSPSFTGLQLLEEALSKDPSLSILPLKVNV